MHEDTWNPLKIPPLVAGHPSPTPPFDFSHFSSIDKTKERRTQALFSLLHPTGPAARGRKQIFVSSHLPPQFKLEKESSPPPSRNHKLGKGL
jgi:hypothetical protein